MSENKLPLIIYDTDMDTDCDDVAALALIAKYVKEGRAQLLSVVTDAPCAEAAPTCEAILRHYGMGDTPIGTIYLDQYPAEKTSRYHSYYAHQKILPPEIYYNRTLAALVGKTDKDYPSSAEVYRRLLASAPDGSVTVLVVGFLTALENLFATEGDEISPLSGVELFRKKVARVVSMGGSAYPESTNNFNYDRDAVGSAAFFDKCPVSVIASSDGDDVVTGYTFTDRLPETHPMRVAYEIYNGGPRKGRSSWDVIATLYALQPNLPFFETYQYGTLRYDEAKELTYWVENAERQDYQLKYSLSAAEMTEYLENELTDGMM